jgi:hypothetical protein
MHDRAHAQRPGFHLLKLLQNPFQLFLSEYCPAAGINALPVQKGSEK